MYSNKQSIRDTYTYDIPNMQNWNIYIYIYKIKKGSKENVESHSSSWF